MIKKCIDSYGYGCTSEIEYETEEELRKLFYKKGPYFRNTCIKCDNRHWNELYKQGVYKHKNRRRIYDASDYGRMTSTKGSINEC